MEKAVQGNFNLSGIQKSVLVILRIIIGWHLLYEGIAKILIPNWTASGYLENSKWIFSGLFHWMAANESIIRIVDFLNIWGLVVIGFFLIIGFAIRYVGVAGIVLLSLYYIANPPFIGTDFGIPVEGHYLFINKTFVEIIALAVVMFFPSGEYLSLDRFINQFRRAKHSEKSKEKDTADSESGNPQMTTEQVNRREALKFLTLVPVFGTFIYGAFRKYNWEKVNAITGATIKVSDTKLKDLRGELPQGKIKDYNISRVIIGGNLIGGWAHSRDLIYVPSLFKAYNTEKKVFETLALAEKAGINTMNITASQLPLINKYKRIFGSNLQTVCQIHPTKENIHGVVDEAIDQGVDLVQIQGNCCDWRVRDGEIDVIAKCLDYIRQQGHIAGLGAHSVQALKACDAEGIEPDFFMKTFHHDQYWSAHPRENRIPFSVDGERSANHDEFHDNMFCLFYDETIEFMKTKKIPFMAFKILAGGAIHPKEGFKFAFENGADFICVGMFDYQIVDDVNIAINTLSKLGPRNRNWYA